MLGAIWPRLAEMAPPESGGNRESGAAASDGGAVVSVRSASSRLNRTASSQFAGIERHDGVLQLQVRSGAEAVSRALELRRWGGSEIAHGDSTPAIGIAGPGDDPEGMRTRAARLAGAADPGQIVVGPYVVANAELPSWLTLSEHPAAAELGGLETGWSEPSGEVRVPALPGAISASVDRPWPLLGRSEELDRVAASWHRVVGGDKALHLIAGEPGSGKSRLAAEAAAEVHRAGGLVLYGSGGGPEDAPYAPFAEALSGLLANGPHLLPDEFSSSPLARLTPELVGPGGGAAGSLGDERGALFGSAVRAFAHLSSQAPVLLVVDDLHACGLSSLRLLSHLARSGTPYRMMIIGTYRPTDLDPAGERGAMITGLRSAPNASHLDLGPLDRDAIRGIAAAIGVSDEEAILDEAATLTERETNGNALMASEVLFSLGERGAAPNEDLELPLPQSLRKLIAARAGGLGEEVYVHLCAAAVAGRRFNPAMVAEALEIPTPELVASMAVGEHAGLVSNISTGEYLTFTHDLTRISLYEESSPSRRGELHRRLAEALERRGHTDRNAAQLARHWRRAEPPDVDRALHFSQIAGDQALERRDHDGAEEWYERALELQESTGADPIVRCDLLLGLGMALRFSGEARFREILLEAARLADELGDTDRLVAAALANNRGFNSVVGDFDRERTAILERAADRLGDRSDPDLVLVLAQLALELTFSPELERRHRLAVEALEIARGYGEEPVLARVLIRCLIARWGPGNAAERSAEAGEAVAISAASDEPLDLFHGLYWQAVAQLELGEFNAAARSLAEQGRIAERLGDPTAIWLTACGRSLHASLRGNLDDAEQGAQAALELGQESSQPDALAFFLSQLCSIRWQQGRLGELAPILAEALERHPGLPSFRSLACLSHIGAGDRRAAADVLAIDLASEFTELPIDPTWLAANATYAHAAAELGNRDAAAILAAALAPHSGLLVSTSISAWGQVDHALGRLRLLLGEPEEGERLLGAAANECARIPAPVWRAQANLDLVRGLAASGRPIGGRAHLEAIAEAERISLLHGAGLLTAGAAELRTSDEVPSEDALSTRISDLGITDRQAEVVALVAAGRSNSQIAAEMTISPSTVKRHLENISRRLAVSGRGELTALLLDGVDGRDGQPPR